MNARRPAAGEPARLTLPRVVRSELVKARSLRSFVWLTVSGALFTLTLGPIQAIGQVVDPDESEPITTVGQATSLALAGMSTACFLFGIAGILLVTGEFPTRAVRTTFTAVPRRGLVVAAKALTAAVLVGGAALATSTGALLIAHQILGRADVELPVDLTTLRAAAGAAGYAVVWALLGQALGWVVRSTVGATMSLIAVMFVLPALATLLPHGVVTAIYAHLPSQAAGALLLVTSDPMSSPPAVALGVVLAYLAGGLALAYRWVDHRDA